MSDACPPILIAAYGNVMAADDAFGPLVAEAVRAKAIEGVEVVNLGMRPAGLLDHLPGHRAVCVVDAARCDGLPPGTLIETDFFDANGGHLNASFTRFSSPPNAPPLQWGGASRRYESS